MSRIYSAALNRTTEALKFECWKRPKGFCVNKQVTFDPDEVVNLWFNQQGLTDTPRSKKLTKARFVDHLESTGGLQVDSVNVVDRAHYLTLWSRFGSYNRSLVDRWIYQDKLAYDYWGHEASILPISHLPIGKRRMQRFPPERWQNASYWERYDTSDVSKRRVMKLLRKHGALESSDFEKTEADRDNAILGWGSVMPKEDKRSLQLLWHAGKVAVCGRRHFRKVYDLANRWYPEVRAATKNEYFDSWLRIGLRGSGIASESHLVNYFTGPNLTAGERAAVIKRNLRAKKIVQVRVQGLDEQFYALPELLDKVSSAVPPEGTTLICPFDSLLWQRKRAEELLGFHYRIEIYVPEAKRKFGYYVLPILHDGRLVGRLDPKLHRDEQKLEIRSLVLEEGFRGGQRFKRALRDALEDLAHFVGARTLDMPSSS